MKDKAIYCGEFCREPELKLSNVCCFSCELRNTCNNKCEEINCNLRSKQISELESEEVL
jgi:hypothetical protein